MQIQYKWWLIPIASVALTGCLKQLGLEADKNSGAEASAISGNAADGYLKGAIACFDINENKACDAGEPQTTTGDGGAFTISATAEQASHPLVVEIIAGETIDEDNPDTPIAETYSLSAPAGYTFVSPLTTLVQNEIETSGASKEEAKAAIQALLGTVLDLEDDYVAGGAVDDSAATAVLKDEFKRLHKVAQVAATIIRTNVSGTASTEGVTAEAKFQLIAGKVTAALGDIKTAVDNAGDSFDPDEIAGSDEIESQTKVDPAKMAEEIEVATTLSSATQANMATVLAGGVYWLEEHTWFDYSASASKLFFGWGTVSYDGTTQTDAFYYYDGVGTGADAFTQDVSENSGDNGGSNNMALVLGTSGWGEPVSMDGGNGPDFVSANSDGSVTMQQGPIKVKLTGVQVDVSSKNIEATLANTRNGLWADAVDSEATFPTGSVAYRLNQVLAENIYMMPWDQPAVSQQDYSNCMAEDAVGTTTNLKSCNSVHLFDGSNPQNHSAAADSVALTVASAGNVNNPLSFKGVVIYHEDDEQGTKKMVLMELVTGGTVNYYKFSRNSAGTFTVTKLRSDKFSSSTVNTKTLVQIPVPYDFPNFFTEHDGDNGGGDGPKFNTFFLTKYDGFWRFGIAFKAGEKLPDDAPFVMNLTAKNAVVDAFDPANLNNFIDPILVENGQDGPSGDEINPCFSGDSKGHDKSFADYTAAVSGCRDQQGSTETFNTDGGFESSIVNDKSFLLPIWKEDGVAHYEEVSFASSGSEFTIATYVQNSEGVWVEDVNETRSGTWSVDSDGYLVVNIGDDEKAWVSLIMNPGGYLEVKIYDLNQDTTDGYSADLDNTDGDSDGDVMSMIWRVPEMAP
ncbi:MAG: hypothetical protein H7A09_01395 [Oceanospirillaceae bacterium]|nr:hypothetical protein [Oceanospirillaceae bacterium]